MLVTPTDPPVTIPVLLPMVATAVGVLLHVPLPGVSLSVVVKPAHTVIEPVMVPGNELTVSTLVVIQPVGKV